MNIYTHTYVHTHTHIYHIYMYVCICMYKTITEILPEYIKLKHQLI